MDESTKTKIEQVFAELITSGEKISVSRVATKAGVSNALIHNRYPDLKIKINLAKEKQRIQASKISDGEEIESLKKKLANSKQKQLDTEQLVLSYEKQNSELWKHIQVLYSMYDQILAERNDFAERLKFC